MNNKGFSLVELLAVIVILGILILFALAAYTRYKTHAINRSYETMVENAAYAAEEYFMDNSSDSSVQLDTLFDKGYISNITDPSDEKKDCIGVVEIVKEEKSDGTKIGVTTYKVTVQCSSRKKCKYFPDLLDDDGNVIKCELTD